MTRRDFGAALLASPLVRTVSPSGGARLLIGEHDPFSGLALLKRRYAAGLRPSDDLPGRALSWQLTGDESFAQQAVAEMRVTHPPVNDRPSRTWRDYAHWSLAFDWLYSYPGFDDELKNRVAEELFSPAARMLRTPDMVDPTQVYYHNYTVRYLAYAAFPLAALDRHADFEARIAPFRTQAEQALGNVLSVTDFVTPLGSYHESLDYMRITWASLVLLAELYRTAGGFDPAVHHSVFRNMGDTYVYKLLPDGTASRENDQEFPNLDSRDTAVLGYAVHRFKDSYSAYLLRDSGWAPKEWVLPVLDFLWNDPDVTPRNPAVSNETELPRQRFFPGVGHLVIRDGWIKDSTWIEFDCGGYYAKHQHLHQNHFTIYHKGYLAIDSGADYTDIESPHYLNYYRRTVAHNTLLVYKTGEKCFWAEDLLPAANDGGQRMDSVRYWNTVRNREDWNRTRDLWDIGKMSVIDHEPGKYHYALGDATRAYSPAKIRRFTREIVYFPQSRTLIVFDRVTSTDPAYRKAWLLHGVREPSLTDQPHMFRFNEGGGELLVTCLLPHDPVVVRRGGPDQQFFTPGDDHGGAWGSGQNWPLDPAEGGPLPEDPKLRHMWKVFYGDNFSELLKSNRKNIVPGAWRVEVSPSKPAEEDTFLHVLEIGDTGSTGRQQTGLIDGNNFAGAALESGPAVAFSTAGSAVSEGDVLLPGLRCDELLLTSLRPNATYRIESPHRRQTLQANSKGLLRTDVRDLHGTRIHIALAPHV